MGDINGRRLVLVTGANRGIGFEMARGLARQGAAVVLACRDREAGSAARETILREQPEASLEVARLDLSSLDSIRSFCADFLSSKRHLAALVNNAATIVPDYRVTADGYELTMGVNYLGLFLLTRLLLPAMAEGGRVINMSSSAYRAGRIGEDFLEYGASRFHEIGTYADSKLAVILFTLELSRRLDGHRIAANAVDPGIVDTGMIHMGKWFDPLADLFFRPFIRTGAFGARPGIRLAMIEDPKVLAGAWIVRDRERDLPPSVLDHPLRRWLWDKTEAVLGLPPLSGLPHR